MGIKFNAKKAKTCKHENITDYEWWGDCGTEYCNGWYEYHCRDCGAYITSCNCMSNEYIDTISSRQRDAIERKRRERKAASAAGRNE